MAKTARKTQKKRNPVARALGQRGLMPKQIPDKRKRLRERAEAQLAIENQWQDGPGERSGG